ncbi:DNA topoisomerase I, mitochondrial [Tachyglossus aculeatus]|uniref:DNA topoisomerase I, mitochondrial n=1 Tax=Tachyglossus aculeatus TaxID=9261 RepID=UPI0018F355BE|nr:DNA topoisomerase I, mitochondrial [Tachyglossus aculeatus]
MELGKTKKQKVKGLTLKRKETRQKEECFLKKENKLSGSQKKPIQENVITRSSLKQKEVLEENNTNEVADEQPQLAKSLEEEETQFKEDAEASGSEGPNLGQETDMRSEPFAQEMETDYGQEMKNADSQITKQEVNGNKVEKATSGNKQSFPSEIRLESEDDVQNEADANGENKRDPMNTLNLGIFGEENDKQTGKSQINLVKSKTEQGENRAEISEREREKDAVFKKCKTKKVSGNTLKVEKKISSGHKKISEKLRKLHVNMGEMGDQKDVLKGKVEKENNDSKKNPKKSKKRENEVRVKSECTDRKKEDTQGRSDGERKVERERKKSETEDESVEVKRKKLSESEEKNREVQKSSERKGSQSKENREKKERGIEKIKVEKENENCDNVMKKAKKKSEDVEEEENREKENSEKLDSDQDKWKEVEEKLEVKKEHVDKEDPEKKRKLKKKSKEKKPEKGTEDKDECPVNKGEMKHKLKKKDKLASEKSSREGKSENEKKTKKSKERNDQEEKEDEGASKWKWWEEEKREDGVKWKQLEHRGPYFAPLYEPLPDHVHFYYNGKPMKLSLVTEEIATFYGKMLHHEYTTKDIFQNNFFSDWRKEMTPEEQKTITCLEECDFTEIHKYFVDKNEARKALPKEEKQKLKEEAEKLQEEFGYCILDGHREKIGNFKTEPPGLFRGRGDHPKMGLLKKRIMPEDVIINCSKDSKIPEPPSGHKWKEVRFDNTVTWLASWTENIQNSIKYIMLNPSSKLKGEKDWQKYEVARRLKGVVDKIRAQYRADWKSKEMKKRQRAVALYFIDKLALRAGNEKEEGETADTVGCCSLRIEHIQLHRELDGQEHVVEFDFLGKDSIRYYNKVPVEKQVYKNLRLFMKNKDPGDDLFDRLHTTSLNKHLQDLMDGLSAKVFRTYNASITLQEQLRALTNAEDNVAAKILSYNRANRAVAILCNHQRATPKTFEKSMQNLQAKIDSKKEQLDEAITELKRAKADHKAKKDTKSKSTLEKKKKLLQRIEEQLMRLSVQATDKEENKQIALGTSKLNYLDPRISVAWCKKFGVPIEKIYNKTQREKFAWAIDMADEDFEF